MDTTEPKLKKWMGEKANFSNYLIGTLVIVIVTLLCVLFFRTDNFISAADSFTPTIIPSDTPTDVPTETPAPTPDTVDCIGPDGKHLQITQQQCDNFNSAWDTPTPFPTATPKPVPRMIGCMSEALAGKIFTFCD